MTDIDTGICYQIRRKGGINHADVEPLTAFDTYRMFQTYGNKWSWARRAIWVTIGDLTLAGSGNGMPHESSTIADNDVDGHFCIHFQNSKTHGTAKVDGDHQSMVKKALNANIAAIQQRINAQ